MSVEQLSGVAQLRSIELNMVGDLTSLIKVTQIVLIITLLSPYLAVASKLPNSNNDLH